ncbi:MAG: hypothetical protein Q9227_003884 [Pyrenula ochraceoflavens]
MAIGISIGDFIATAKLISSIVSSLKRSANAPSQYRELERELFGLQKALNEVEHLQVEPSHQSTANAIKCAALGCQHVLEEFDSKLSRYETSLGNENASGRFKTVGKKLRWGFGMSEDVTKLRVYIAAHVGSLNMRLLTLGLESTALLSTSIQDSRNEQLSATIDTTISLSGLQKQQNVQNEMLEKILQILSSVLEPRIDTLLDLTKKVWDANLYSTNLLEKAVAGRHSPDTRFTWLQEPVRLEDLFGRYIAIPSEYSFEMMEAVILARYRNGPGARRVQRRRFQISNSSNSDQILSEERFAGFVPGMRLRMAILLDEVYMSDERCPVPSCGSKEVRECTGGGKHCGKCNLWFGLATYRRKRCKEVDDESDTQESSERTKRKKRHNRLEFDHFFDDDDDDEISLYKNIRLGNLPPMRTTEIDLSVLRLFFPKLQDWQLAQSLDYCNGDVVKAVNSVYKVLGMQGIEQFHDERGTTNLDLEDRRVFLLRHVATKIETRVASYISRLERVTQRAISPHLQTVIPPKASSISAQS